jgi:aryl-alcohol dehydrogenase-like predicted oxidoreductase
METNVGRTVLGKTGIQATSLGIGGHEYRWLHAGNIKDGRHLRFNPERKRVIQRALEAGINLFDTSFIEEVQSLGHVFRELGWPADAVVNGMIINVLSRAAEMGVQEQHRFVQDEIDTRLKLLGRDYFDVFMLCCIQIGYDQGRVADIIELYKREQEKGKFRYIGVSCHPHQLLLGFLEAQPPIDVVMFPYNYAIARNTGGIFAEYPALLRRAKEQDLGMIGFKALCWTLYGVPFTLFCSQCADVQTLVRQSIRWHCTKGETHSTIIGVETVEELDSILEGTRISLDEELLDLHTLNYHDPRLLFENAPKHSREISSRIVDVLKQLLEVDLGSDLAAYKAHIEKERPDFQLPLTNFL